MSKRTNKNQNVETVKKETWQDKFKKGGKVVWTGVKKVAPIAGRVALDVAATVVGMKIYSALNNGLTCDSVIIDCQDYKVHDIPEKGCDITE